MINYLVAAMLNLPLAGRMQLSPSEICCGVVMGVILTFAMFLLDKILPHNGIYVVYRHYAGLRPDIEDRKHDHQLILAAYERSISAKIHDATGIKPSATTGRPWFEFLMRAEDIPNWLEEIDELLSSGKLKYYTGFGFDDKGLGLEDPRNLGEADLWYTVPRVKAGSRSQVQSGH